MHKLFGPVNPGTTNRLSQGHLDVNQSKKFMFMWPFFSRIWDFGQGGGKKELEWSWKCRQEGALEFKGAKTRSKVARGILGVLQKGSRERCLPVFFFSENETEENGKKGRKRKNRNKKTAKKEQNGNGKKRQKWKKSEETEKIGRKRKKSEATPFWRPLLRNPEIRSLDTKTRTTVWKPPFTDAWVCPSSPNSPRACWWSMCGQLTGPERRFVMTFRFPRNCRFNSWPGPSAEMCRGLLLCKIWRILPGIFLEKFSDHLLPTKMRRKNPARKSAKKSGCSKIKIREESVLPKSDPNNREERSVHDHHRKKIFWETFLASKKNFPGRWWIQNPYGNQENHIYHRNLSSVAPIFSGKEKFRTGAGRRVLSFSLDFCRLSWSDVLITQDPGPGTAGHSFARAHRGDFGGSSGWNVHGQSSLETDFENTTAAGRIATDTLTPSPAPVVYRIFGPMRGRVLHTTSAKGEDSSVKSLNKRIRTTTV